MGFGMEWYKERKPWIGEYGALFLSKDNSKIICFYDNNGMRVPSSDELPMFRIVE